MGEGLYPPVIICQRPKRSVKFILLAIFSLLASHCRLWTAVVSLWPSLLFLYSIFLPITVWQIELARRQSIIVLRLILLCPLFPPLLSLRLSFSCCPHYGTVFSFLHPVSPITNGFMFLSTQAFYLTTLAFFPHLQYNLIFFCPVSSYTVLLRTCLWNNTDIISALVLRSFADTLYIFAPATVFMPVL